MITRETGKKGAPRIQFNNFQLLQDVINAYAKKLSIQLSLNGINEVIIDELQELFKMHKGNHSLNFVIYDEDSIKVNLKSRKQKIKISQELLSHLDSRKVFYKLN